MDDFKLQNNKKYLFKFNFLLYIFSYMMKSKVFFSVEFFNSMTRKLENLLFCRGLIDIIFPNNFKSKKWESVSSS